MKKLLLSFACLCMPSVSVDLFSLAHLYEVPEAGYIKSTRRDALKILNNAEHQVIYFYTNKNNNGQDRWNKTIVNSQTNTWDWTWKYCTTSDHIEFMYKLSSNSYLYMTIVFNYRYTIGSNKFNEGFYWTVSDDGEENPGYNDKIWHRIVDDVGCYQWYNVHTKIEMSNTESGGFLVNWNDHILVF